MTLFLVLLVGVILFVGIAVFVKRQKAPRHAEAVEPLDILDPRYRMLWHGPDPVQFDGPYQRDPRLGDDS